MQIHPLGVLLKRVPYFLLFPFRWFCHFDDDNYVNVVTLVKTLQNFNPHEDVYLGKPSLLKAMEVQ